MEAGLVTPNDVALRLAAGARDLRLIHDWTRQTLATRAGVSVASLRRFETTGRGSLELLLKVAHALGRLDEFLALLQPPAARTIDELESKLARNTRQRGRH